MSSVIAADAGAGTEAVAHADAALATDFGGADGVHPSGLYPAELWPNGWRALRLASPVNLQLLRAAAQSP